MTGDGVFSLVFTNQHGEIGTNVYRVPLPEDPFISPWPSLETVARGRVEKNPGRKEGVQPEEGLAIGDIDGDGRNELVAGTHWYKFQKGKWEGFKFAEGYITTKIAIADIDHDGKNEIVLSEGDPLVYGQMNGGKLAWFKPKARNDGLWEEHRVADGLYDAHSLRVGNLCGNGRNDILSGEVGHANPATDQYQGHDPVLAVFENDGAGKFRRHIVDSGTGYHDAYLVDTRKIGKLDIVTKPLHGAEKWNIHVYYAVT